MIEPLCAVAVEPHGLLAVGHAFGTPADGGAFEQAYVFLVRFEGDRVVATELHKPEDVDRARVRLAALGADPAPEPTA